MICLYVFLAIFLYKLLSNIISYFNNSRLYKIWKSFFLNDNNHAVTYTSQIVSNFKKAGIKNSTHPITIPTGHNYVANTKYSYFDNIFMKSPQTLPIISEFFLQAQGIYRKRIFESFNPLYWIELIIFLPKNIIAYFGLNTDSIFTKIFQLIFWIIDSIIIVYYRDEIAFYIQNLINNLFK